MGSSFKDTNRSVVTTQGICVQVESRYLANRSHPPSQRYVFAYSVAIRNESESPFQLRSRHWVITHGDGRVEEVRGAGVVGQQPVLVVGDSFKYTSGCVLRTPRGMMHGSYSLERVHGGETFDVEIGQFALAMPYSLN